MSCAHYRSTIAPQSARRGSTLWIVILLILVVGLAACSVVSTIYAMRTIEQLDQTRADLAESGETLDEIVVAVAKSGKLKGASAAEAREQVFGPAVKHYERVIEKYDDDEQMLPSVVNAKFRRAALQAKLGQKECVRSLGEGTGSLAQMIDADFDAESFPSFRHSVMAIAEPMDWVSVKDSSPMEQGMGLYTGVRSAAMAYGQLSEKYPQSVVFRDNVAELAKASALLLGAMGKRGMSLEKWQQARDVLETIVRDEPDNVEAHERLAESLSNTAKMARSDGNTDQAVADYKRAVEVHQAIVEANPEDETAKKALARAQTDLESAEKLANAKQEEPADSENQPAPEEQASKEDGSQEASQ